MVESFYWRYAEENALTYAEAQKRLNKAEIGELQDYVDLVMKNIGKYNQDVNNMSIKARMTRYQALEAQVDAILRQLYAVDYQAEAERPCRKCMRILIAAPGITSISIMDFMLNLLRLTRGAWILF